MFTTASSKRTIDELDGDTTTVQRRCFVPDAQSAGGASLFGQTSVGWRGLGPRDQEKRTRQALFGGNVLADFSSTVQSHCEMQNTKTG